MNNIEKISSALKNGIVRFNYKKVNGEMRYAIGTTNHNIIKAIFDADGSRLPSESNKRANDANITYYDLSRLDFRNFRKENFEKIEMEDISLDDAVIYAMAIAFTFTDYDEYDYERLCVLADKMHSGIATMVTNVFWGTGDPDRGNPEVALNMAKAAVKQVYEDPHTTWCRRYNHGYGLNGVSLAAGGIISSGFDCFGNPISHRNVPISAPATNNEPIVRPSETPAPQTKSEPYVTLAEVSESAKTTQRNKAEILVDIAKKHAELSRLYAELSAAEMR